MIGGGFGHAACGLERGDVVARLQAGAGHTGPVGAQLHFGGQHGARGARHFQRILGRNGGLETGDRIGHGGSNRTGGTGFGGGMAVGTGAQTSRAQPRAPPCVATSTCKGQAVWAMTRRPHGECVDD